MINLPSDFSTASTVGSGYPALEPDGYVCKVLKAELAYTSKGSQMLVVSFDINEGPQMGYFKQRYNHDKEHFKDDAKYKGVYRLFIENVDGSTNSFFKSFTTAVEESNQGFKFTGDENTLVNKIFGCIFREREYLRSDNTVSVFCEPFVAVSAEKIRNKDFTVPAKKTLTDTSAPKSTYTPPQRPSYAEIGANHQTVDVDDDDLPF